MASGDISIKISLDGIEEIDGLRPEISEVASILRARTRSDEAGGEIGTFNNSTRPTATEVEDYITGGMYEVALRLPDEIPESALAFARRLISTRAAMSVELSYDPDRTGDGSAYDRLREQYEAGMVALQDALADAGAATTLRIASIDVVSPTLAPFPAEIRELIAPAWPVP